MFEVNQAPGDELECNPAQQPAVGALELGTATIDRRKITLSRPYLWNDAVDPDSG